MKLPELKTGELINYTAIALSRANLLPSGLRHELKDALLYGDVIASCGVAATESYQQNHSLKEARNTANRYIYQCLRGLG